MVATPEPDPTYTGERRQLTIMFCDVVDSTGIAQSMDAEDWRDVLAPFLAKAAEVVTHWGGHVARSLGDGLLIYFGWPSAGEHDGERAIRAGLAVVETLETFPPLAAAGGARLSMRVGVHTGPVVVDDVGEVFGDSANIAARVQSAAEPGSIFVTGASLRLVAGLFLVEDRGLYTLKGVRDPVALFRVVRPSGVRSRLDIAAGRLTRFVGREDEVALLAERWERAAGGRGQVVLVVAEAGVGKSRVAYEFRRRLGATPHTWLECAGTPYTAGTPFHPVIALVSQGLEFQSSDSPADRLASIRRGLGELASDGNVALLSHFLGLPVAEAMQVSPEAQRRRTLELLEHWVLAMAAAQPLVLLVEDLHWCDASTLELIGDLLAANGSARLLMLLTARPEFSLPWEKAEHLAVIDLVRLSAADARRMIATLVDADLPAATVDVLVDRADGVPLYLEELTMSLVDPTGRRDVDAIPATLADSLMSRLDRLHSIKDVAQRASVIGREFSYELLAAVTEVGGAELRLALDKLCEEQLLFAAGEPPDARYVFKHALVQEAAYASLLKRTRLQLHGRIAETLERGLAGSAAAEPEVIARHYEQAGMAEASIAHYLRAGEVAIHRSANEEAIGHLERGLSIVASLTESTERDRLELRLLMALSTPLMAVRSWAGADYAKTCVRARELASTLGQSPDLPRVLASLAANHLMRAELAPAIEVAGEAILAADRTGDSYDLLYAHQIMAIPLQYQGAYRQALHHLLRAIELYREDIHGPRAFTEGVDRGVMAFAHAAHCWYALGHPDQAVAIGELAVELARRLNHPLSIAHAVFSIGTVCYNCELPVPLQRYAREMVGLGDRFGLPMYSGFGRVLLGGAIAMEGEIDNALEAIQEGFANVSGIRIGVGAPMVFRMLADAQRQAGRLDDALASVQLGLVLADQYDQHFDDAELLRVRGMTLMESGHQNEEAEQALQESIAIAQRQQARSLELRSTNVLAQLRHLQGRSKEAHALLQPLHAWFTEGFQTGALKTARSLLEASA